MLDERDKSLGTVLSAGEVTAPAEPFVIRYAQCWEDADVLLSALGVRPGDVCLSIASAGDNTLALLTQNPGRVIAVDSNPAQLACLELRVAAYRELSHAELLELIGSVPCDGREKLYRRCRTSLGTATRAFWDSHVDLIASGIGTIGKLERYFQLFRTRVLPLVHTRARVARMLAGGTRQQREQFYVREWNTWRWRLVFRVFFSRFLMSRLGRDPAFFKFAQGSVADRFLERARFAVTELDPGANPYLQWILTGSHSRALPVALRPENFDAIRRNLDRLEWHCSTLEDYIGKQDVSGIDRYNLSDVFEYMSAERTAEHLQALVAAGRTGGRLVYWNTLVPRSRPDHLADRLMPLDNLAMALYQEDKAFFYNRLVVEEIR